VCCDVHPTAIAGLQPRWQPGLREPHEASDDFVPTERGDCAREFLYCGKVTSIAARAATFVALDKLWTQDGHRPQPASLRARRTGRPHPRGAAPSCCAAAAASGFGRSAKSAVATAATNAEEQALGKTCRGANPRASRKPPGGAAAMPPTHSMPSAQLSPLVRVRAEKSARP
jgi:hypothetical protein